MAYKFLVGPARLSGSITHEEAVTFEDEASFTSISASGQVDLPGDVRFGAANYTKIAANTGVLSSSAQATLFDIALDRATIQQIDLNGGAIDGTVIGASAQESIKATSVSGSGLVSAAGGINVAERFTVSSAGAVVAGGAVEVKSTISGSGLASAAGGLNVAERFTVSSAGAVVAAGPVTADSLVVGTADLDETDLEQIDDISPGTVSASKAVVVDSDKDAAGFRNISGTGNITAGGSFVIGSADLNETDLEKLDGITNGTAVANKAMVLDAQKDISGARDISVDQDLKAGRNISGSAQLQGGAVAVDGSVTAGTSFIIGSADLNETDLEKLDGITNGAGAANKALVLNADGDITTGIRNLTVTNLSSSLTLAGQSLSVDGAITGGKLVVGSADMSETDLEKLDGITDGTVAANKAVVVDSDKDAAGFRAVSGSGVFSAAGGLNVAERFTVSSAGAVEAQGALEVKSTISGSGLASAAGGLNVAERFTVSSAGAVVSADSITAGSSFIIGSADLNETDLEKLDGITNGTVAANKAVVVSADADATGFRNVSGSGLFSAAGGLNVAERFTVGSSAMRHKGIATDDFARGSDGLFFNSGSTGRFKSVSTANFLTAIAGAGLTVQDSQLKTEAGTVNVVGPHHEGAQVTLSEGTNFFAQDLTASAFTILPALAASEVGSTVTVKAKGGVSGTSQIVIKANSGGTIDGEADVRIESPFGAVTCVYVATNDWRII